MKQGNSKQNRYNASARFYKSREIAKKRKEQIALEHYRGSKIKKNFSKLCAREGIESDRVHIGTRKAVENAEDKKKKKKSKKKPFERELLLSESRKKDEIKKELEIVGRKREIEESKNRREMRKKMFSKKTSKGQPIMNDRVFDLLNKIKKLT
mmetsp:Transcript_33846/g.34480  ORF Transcript_33846/g.34480 Transcript_33846/m.34480 type:complete len:153 (+) Transcript_33846:225-683(+)